MYKKTVIIFLFLFLILSNLPGSEIIEIIDIDILIYDGTTWVHDDISAPELVSVNDNNTDSYFSTENENIKLEFYFSASTQIHYFEIIWGNGYNIENGYEIQSWDLGLYDPTAQKDITHYPSSPCVTGETELYPVPPYRPRHIVDLIVNRSIDSAENFCIREIRFFGKQAIVRDPPGQQSWLMHSGLSFYQCRQHLQT